VWKDHLSKFNSNNTNLLIQIPTKAGSLWQLKETLGALLPAIHSAPEMLKIRIRVFLDGNDENIISFLATLNEVDYTIQQPSAGKWNSIKTLALGSATTKTDWVATLDVGTKVPENIFSAILPYLKNTGIYAIYPAYQVENAAGVLQQLYWNFERFLKSIENKAGGPVSAHGALMFFRAEELKRAINHLPQEDYANDDVVLPLILRLLNPLASCCYLKNIIVHDSDISVLDNSGVIKVDPLKRRKRLAKGNLQWIKLLSNSKLTFKNPVALILSLRRIFRLFWGYWLVAILLGLGLCISPFIPLIFLIPIALSALKERTAGLFEAFISSLASPFWIFAPQSGVEWR
jgi:cellulose synthase/poly-beta-1,6-N-acetylglucosamine synthase-like glycosyltransferase